MYISSFQLKSFLPVTKPRFASSPADSFINVLAGTRRSDLLDSETVLGLFQKYSNAHARLASIPNGFFINHDIIEDRIGSSFSTAIVCRKWGEGGKEVGCILKFFTKPPIPPYTPFHGKRLEQGTIGKAPYQFEYAIEPLIEYDDFKVSPNDAWRFQQAFEAAGYELEGTHQMHGNIAYQDGKVVAVDRDMLVRKR